MTLRGDADRFYLALLRHEREASREMARAYGVAWRRVRQRLDALLAQMAAAREAGQDVSLSWLFQQQRLEALQQQIETEMRRWASVATERATELQRDAVDLAQRQAEAETLAALGPPPPGVAVTWKRLSKEALTDLVGFASDGTPLRQLLDALGAEASQQVREALIAGMATGENPRSIARRVKEAFGGDLVRALRVSRTETMRAYRTAALRNYRANDDVVKAPSAAVDLECGVRHAHLCGVLGDARHETPPGRRASGSPEWPLCGLAMDEKLGGAGHRGDAGAARDGERRGALCQAHPRGARQDTGQGRRRGVPGWGGYAGGLCHHPQQCEMGHACTAQEPQGGVGRGESECVDSGDVTWISERDHRRRESHCREAATLARKASGDHCCR